MTTVATSTSAFTTAYSNQRKVDRCQNGVLWAIYTITPVQVVNDRAMAQLRYSLDDGATWNDGGHFFNASINTAVNQPSYSVGLFIDLDDYAHVVFKDNGDGSIYYRRGTSNAGRTAWTWSAPVTIVPGTEYSYPDVVAHREGTGWSVHIVYSQSRGTDTTRAYHHPLSISSGGTVTLGTRVELGAYIGSALHSFPSIDFNHTGDGKTVAGGTPHLYAGWSGGGTGAGKGIRFRKATYSAGAWTWGTQREIDSTRYFTDVYASVLVFDGTRCVIAGAQLDSGGLIDVVLYERDAADTTTTQRVLFDNAGNDDQLRSGVSVSYDAEGNIYLFGTSSGTIGAPGVGTKTLYYRKWTRSTLTVGPKVIVDGPGGLSDTVYVSAKRGYSNSRIEFIYKDGTASPYNVTYGSLVVGTKNQKRMIVG